MVHTCVHLSFYCEMVMPYVTYGTHLLTMHVYTYHRLSYSSGSTKPPWRHCRTPRTTDSGSKQIPRYLHVQTTLSCFFFPCSIVSWVYSRRYMYVHIHVYIVCIYRIARKFGGELNWRFGGLYYNHQIKICPICI